MVINDDKADNPVMSMRIFIKLCIVAKSMKCWLANCLNNKFRSKYHSQIKEEQKYSRTGTTGKGQLGEGQQGKCRALC